MAPILVLACLAALAAAEDDALLKWARDVAGRKHGLPNFTVEEVWDQPRQLTEHTCNPIMLTITSPPSWDEFQNCLEKAYKTMDYTVAGMELYHIAACWCANDITELVNSYHCCAHSSFEQLCTMDCKPDCQSVSATQCYSKCPALCLEPDYAPPDCDCEDGCWKYTICIANQSLRKTASGEYSKICDDEAFHGSDAVMKYEKCLNEQPMRTNWHRHNSFRYCACTSGLREKLSEHQCCGADWASAICDLDCLSEAECSKPEATQCLEQCREVCHELHPSRITTDCVGSCFQNNSCVKYESCPPLDILSYEYICPTTGNPPGDNGCCPDTTSYLGEACPPLCEIKRNYIVYDALECQCFECPTDDATRIDALKLNVLDELEESGRLMMQDVCQQVDLTTCPTEIMLTMLEDRTAELKSMLSDHDGEPDADLEERLKIESSKHGARILLEAHRTEDCMQGDEKSCGESPYVTSSPAREQKKAGDSTGIIIAVVVVMLILGVGAVLFYLRMNAKKRAAEAANASDVAPRDGDSQVVVGRPVQPGQENAVVGGAPVATGGKAAQNAAPAKGAEP